MAKRKSNDEEYCSFCYKSAHEVERLLAGPAGVNICNECIQVCHDIMNSQENGPDSEGNSGSGKKKTRNKAVPAPSKIKDRLDEYVIGHDDTKKILSVAVYNHYIRLQHVQNGKSDVEIEKSNILLLGDTGTGKTLLAKTLASIVDVPFAVADATTLTEAGYVGEDVENILLKLIQDADGDIAKAETGIIFIDEIDKISRRSENRSITRDVSGEGVQQALLKILEGTQSSVPPQGGRKHPEQQNLKIDTKNILFICGGAFDGLADLIRRRVGTQQIGFSISDRSISNENGHLLKQVEPDDLIKFGLIPEITGRIPVIGVLDKLERDSFFRILQEPKNALTRQYQKQYELMGTELSFEQDFLENIVDKAYSKALGVRALRSIMEKYITPLTYHLASASKKTPKVTLTECLITDGVDEFMKQMTQKINKHDSLSEVS